MRITLASLLLAVACGHAAATSSKSSTRDGKAPAPPSTPLTSSAQELSAEARAMHRAEAELLWKRWTTGAGPLPSGALAGHAALAEPEAARIVGEAALHAKGDDAVALRLLQTHLSTLALARRIAPEAEALDRARAQLAFAAPDDARPERGERDLDRLLTDEPDAKKRAAIAQAEAKATEPLAELVLARDAALERALVSAGAGSWGDLEERLHGISLFELASLAERTLGATEEVASRAVAGAALRNLGVTPDRLRRGDLPRLVRSSGADASFPMGAAWEHSRATLTALHLEQDPALHVDTEPSPSKGPRPLAVLVDPPADVRLSLRPSGGYEEQRATLHETARAMGGLLTRAPRWELSVLGDGAGTEAAAQLLEDLAGEPQWLREQTALRGDPLEELVHTQAARRLLAARRAAALALFEIRRHEAAEPAETQAALYRGLLQRATFAVMGDDDARRWALEADTGVRAAPMLLAMVLAAQVEEKLAPKPETPWWRAPDAAATLKTLWSPGRSLTGTNAARALGLASLDPAALARMADRRLAYTAPEGPPPAERPDYKYMQGDRKKRRRGKRRR